MTTYAQLFCTVSDLVADTKSPGVDETRMVQAIREASDYLQKEIGFFIPVTLTYNFKGSGCADLFLYPGLLSITSIENDELSLNTDDYILKPDNAHWPNGPYSKIVVSNDSAISGWTDYTDAVSITGKWGLYNRSASTSATVADTTQQSATQTTLKVSNGSKVSPGMVLLIGTEQELVTSWSDPTASVTTVTEAVTASTDQLTLANAALVSVGEVIRIDFEQMKITDIRTSTNLASVIRGYNGTGRVTHADNAAVDAYRTANVERSVNGTTAAVHANGVAISRYFAPEDIQFLTRQIATLMVNKALSGYQGRTGNEQLGVVFYNDAFPRYELEQIKAKYILPRFP